MAMLICSDVQGLVEQHQHPHLPPLSAAAWPSSPVQLELEFSLWNPDDLITRFHESWMWKGYASGVQLGTQYFVGHWTPSVHQLINQIHFYDDFRRLILISSTTFAKSLISLWLAFDVWINNHKMSSSLVVKKTLSGKCRTKSEGLYWTKLNNFMNPFLSASQSNVKAMSTLSSQLVI